jgi:hypothetical protein
VQRAFSREKAALPKLDKALTQDAFMRKARQVLWAMLHARKVSSIQLTRLDGGASVEQLDRLFGKGNWIEHRGRIVYQLDDADAQLAAAREVLSRGEPQLNRADPGSVRSFRVYRLDPNKTDGDVGIQVEEIANAEVPQLEEPRPTELDIEAEDVDD